MASGLFQDRIHEDNRTAHVQVGSDGLCYERFRQNVLETAPVSALDQSGQSGPEQFPRFRYVGAGVWPVHVDHGCCGAPFHRGPGM